MYRPSRDDESTSLLRYVEQQLDALRASTLGLTEEQLRATPCASALSIGGLVKHVTYGMQGAARRLREGTFPALDEEAYSRYQASFVPTDDDSGVALLAAFDDARAVYVAELGAADPDGDATEPPAPWFGVFEPQPIRWRYYLLHQVEEMARHAGHADIIREQLDGMSVPALVMTVEGVPANDFFQPYVPAPGTIGAD
jgi:hypothetical protein